MVRMRSAVWLFSAQVTTLLVSFPMSVLLAHALGASGKGALTETQLIAVLGTTLLGIGLPSAATYYVARREAHPRDVVRLALVMAAACVAVLAIPTVVFGPQISQALFKTTSPVMLYLGAFMLGPALYGQTVSGILLGQGRIRTMSIVNISALAIQLGIDAVLAMLHLLTPIVAVCVWMFATASMACLSTYLVLKGEGRGQEGVLRLARRFYRYGLAIWASGGMSVLSNRQDVFFLAFFRSPREVGIYSIGVTLAELSWYVPSALAGVLFPKVAAGGDSDTAELTARLTRFAWPVALLSETIVVLVSIPVVPILFGTAFSGAVVPLALLGPGIVSMTVVNLVGAYVSGIGHPGDATKANVVNLLVNVAVNLLLIPVFGIAGAALASSVSYTSAAVVLAVLWKRRSGLSVRELLVPTISDARAVADAARRALARVRARGSQV
jgi:O-antigen/teichoic acid export membrane protein